MNEIISYDKDEQDEYEDVAEVKTKDERNEDTLKVVNLLRPH